MREGRIYPFDKQQALEGFLSEIQILSTCTERRLDNIVKIKHASFEGTIVKERLSTPGSPLNSSDSGDAVERQLRNLNLAEAGSFEEPRVLKRRHPVCYYVMSFAEYGELYRLIESNERLSDNLIRYLFHQLVSALSQLHRHGFVHRDVKAENLLIDRHLRLIIADFNFAAPLAATP